MKYKHIEKDRNIKRIRGAIFGGAPVFGYLQTRKIIKLKLNTWKLISFQDSKHFVRVEGQNNRIHRPSIHPKMSSTLSSIVTDKVQREVQNQRIIN